MEQMSASQFGFMIDTKKLFDDLKENTDYLDFCNEDNKMSIIDYIQHLESQVLKQRMEICELKIDNRMYYESLKNLST